jgi:hypothetical protein
VRGPDCSMAHYGVPAVAGPFSLPITSMPLIQAAARKFGVDLQEHGWRELGKS